MFVITDPEYMYLSSSMVRQVASFGGDVTDFLPDGICKDIVERLTQGEQRSDHYEHRRIAGCNG